jgi:hypothetical protein
MSKGKRRGSGGHPARVAAARDRDRAAREQSDGVARLTRLARRLADEAGELGAPLDAELWASELLGTFWAALGDLTLEQADDVDDPALEFGGPLLELLARIGDRGAAIAIQALAVVDDGELGLVAKGVVEDQGLDVIGGQLPAWAADIGELEITQAAVIRESVFDDAVTVLLEGRHPDGELLAVSVLINHNYGGLAVDALAIESVDGVRLNSDDDDDEVEEFSLDPIDVGEAADLIDSAILQTDDTWDPPVTEEYWSARALALLLSGLTPRQRLAEEPAELTDEDREALLEAFRDSPEGAGLAGSGAASRAVMLAIDYAADTAGGDPLRASPDSVDVFFGWASRSPDVTDAEREALATVMDAWVRFAGRRRGTPLAAVQLTRRTISELATELASG